MSLRRLLTLAALAVLGSAEAVTAQTRSFPSLQRRSVESRDRDAEVAARVRQQAQAVETAAPDEALVRTVADLAGRSATAARTFDNRFAAGQASVAAARGAAVGSENWVVAQQEISALDSARYDCVAALATLDTLYVERANAPDEARSLADVATIAQPRAAVLAQVDGQNDRLDALRASLPQP